MAYRKKESTEKMENDIATMTEVADLAEADQKQVEPDQKPIERVVQKKKEYVERGASDPIKCRSIVQGSLIFKGSKSQNVYRWDAPNDVVDIEYQDLRSARLSKHPFLMRGYFIIEDDDLLNTEEWSEIKKKYGEMYSRKDLTSIFRLELQDMVRAINSLPDGVKAQMGNIAKGLMQQGSLDSIRKIKAIDSVLGTDLMLFIDGDNED